MDQFLAMQTDALTTIAVNVVTKTQGAIARNVTSELESVRSRRLGLQWRPKKKQLREAWGANQRNRRMPWRGRRRLLAKRRGSRPARGANRLAAYSVLLEYWSTDAVFQTMVRLGELDLLHPFLGGCMAHVILCALSPDG